MHRILIALLTCATLTGHAGNPKIDSLKTLLPKRVTSKAKINIYRNIGREYYKSQIQYDSAFYFAKVAFEMAKQQNLEFEQSQALFDQAAIYSAVGDLENALQVYQKSLVHSKNEINYNPKVARLLTATTNNIGDIYLKKRDLKNAYNTFKEVLELSRVYHFTDIESIALLNLGEINFYEGSFEASKLNFLKAKEINTNFVESLPPYYYLMARTLKAQGVTEEAIAFAIKGLKKGKKESDLQGVKDLSLLLSELYESQENYRTASTYTSMALTYGDSIHVKGNKNELEKVLLTYQLKKQENEIEVLAVRNKYLTTIYALAALGLLLLVVLVMRQLKIVRMTRSIHKIQNDLIKSELELRKSTPSTTFQAAMGTSKGNV